MQYPPGIYTQVSALQDVPADVGTLVVVGGTFNPVHRAHIELPSLARKALASALAPPVWLVFVPAGLSPFKAADPAASTPEPSPRQRASLLRLATRTCENASVWEDEIDRFEASVAHHQPAPSFTIDTLQRLKSFRPSAALRLLIGTDQLASFHRWKEPRQILSLARPITLLREPFASTGELATELSRVGFWNQEEIIQLAGTCVSVPRMDISATAIRRKMSSGLPASSLPELDSEVASEIEAHGWYRPRH